MIDIEQLVNLGTIQLVDLEVLVVLLVDLEEPVEPVV
tara:strand:+ start:383 stop:493 length:111 start_codon:yes stop_codon:yes gene_type:complete